jgi:hypothetical protein
MITYEYKMRLYLWRRANRADAVTNKAPISLRIEIDGYPRAEHATGVTATEAEWSQAAQRKQVVRGMSKPDQQLLGADNSRLAEKLLTLERAYNNYKAQGGDPSPANLLEMLRGGRTKDHRNGALLALIDAVVEQASQAGRKKSTVYNLGLAREHVAAYLKQTHRLQLLGSQVDWQWCRAYERHCITQQLSGATIRDFLGLVFRALTHALAEGIFKENKVAGYKYLSKYPKADKHCLPLDELQLLLDYRFSEQQITRAAHAFYFCSFTGLSYCDYRRFALDPVPFLCYVKGGAGQYTLGIGMQRQKNLRTDKDLSQVKEFFVPLFQEARLVFFTLYRGELPVYSDNYYRILLQRAAQEARLSIPDLSSKDARSTFSQHMRDRYGSEISSAMAGHTREVMDERYSGTSSKRVVEQIQLTDLPFRASSN